VIDVPVKSNIHADGDRCADVCSSVLQRKEAPPLVDTIYCIQHLLPVCLNYSIGRSSRISVGLLARSCSLNVDLAAVRQIHHNVGTPVTQQKCRSRGVTPACTDTVLHLMLPASSLSARLSVCLSVCVLVTALLLLLLRRATRSANDVTVHFR